MANASLLTEESRLEAKAISPTQGTVKSRAPFPRTHFASKTNGSSAQDSHKRPATEASQKDSPNTNAEPLSGLANHHSTARYPQRLTQKNESRIGPRIGHNPPTKGPSKIPPPKKQTSSAKSNPTTNPSTYNDLSPSALQWGKKRNKPRNRKPSPLWQRQYKYLSSLITPIDEIPRDDFIYEKVWLAEYASNEKYQFRNDRVRVRSQGRRRAFILAQKKNKRRKHFHRLQVLAAKRRERTRLYRMAYLKFKKGRISWLRETNLLQSAYDMGWTAAREWVQWQKMRQPTIRKKRERRAWWRKRLTFDKAQRQAERRIFEYPVDRCD